MRRTDKEITDRGIIESIIARATVCHVGLCDGGVPYVVPVCYGYEDNCLYVHSAPEGRKIDALKRNNTVCVEFDVDEKQVTSDHLCKWGMCYYSVIGYGVASFVDDPREKAAALNVIVDHYGGADEYTYPQRSLDAVVIIKIELDTLTSKQSGYDDEMAEVLGAVD